MLQRSCREIDERRDFFVATNFFRHAEIFSSRRDFFGVFSSPGNIWRAPYSPHFIPPFLLLPVRSANLSYPKSNNTTYLIGRSSDIEHST